MRIPVRSGRIRSPLAGGLWLLALASLGIGAPGTPAGPVGDGGAPARLGLSAAPDVPVPPPLSICQATRVASDATDPSQPTGDGDGDSDLDDLDDGTVDGTTVLT